MTLYLAYDALDVLNKSRTWDTTSEYPVTSLPLHLQLLFAFSVCIGTAISIEKPAAYLSLIGVSFGLPPQNFPEQFYHPFHATSLSDFWTHRWHEIFRRVSFILSSGLLDLSARIFHNEQHRRTRQFIKGCLIFGVSYLMHLILMYRVVPIGLVARSTRFFEPGTFKFFFLQPLGMLIEAVVVKPLSTRLFKNPRWRRAATRTFAWGFMLFSGRYWADVWVKKGCWSEAEKTVPLSVWRGIWQGRWIL